MILSFTNQDADQGPVLANLNKTGEGTFAENGSFLGQPGEWEIKVTTEKWSI